MTALASVIDFPVYKVCARCSIRKEGASFHKRGNRLGTYCKDCVQVRSRKRHERNSSRSSYPAEILCKKCDAIRPASEFHKNRTRHTGRALYCKACDSDARKIYAKEWRDAHPRYMAANRRKKLYGLEETEYLNILAAQGGVCAICKSPPDAKRSLSVDHEKTPGHNPKIARSKDDVRGLLCSACNLALGFLRDNPLLCRLSAEYLERYAQKRGRHG